MKNAQSKVYEIAHIRQIAGVVAIQDIIKSYAFYDQESKTTNKKWRQSRHFFIMNI